MSINNVIASYLLVRRYRTNHEPRTIGIRRKYKGNTIHRTFQVAFTSDIRLQQSTITYRQRDI